MKTAPQPSKRMKNDGDDWNAKRWAKNHLSTPTHFRPNHLGAPPPPAPLLAPVSPLEPVPAVKYVVDVPDRDGELELPNDRDRWILACLGGATTSSPSSLAPAASSISGVSHSLRFAATAAAARERGASSCSPCSVTGARTSLAPWLLLLLRHVDSTLPPLPGRAADEEERG